MIDIKDFPLLKYSCYPEGNPKPISGMIGLDTEAYTSGEPFLCMLSTGEEVPLSDPWKWFFREVPAGKLSKKELKSLAESSGYLNRHYCTYNLKYDSGAVLYRLPDELKYRLWKYGSVSVKESGKSFLIEYIPHKLLAFYHQKFFIKIWDIAQYFKMSLAEASETYLHEKGKLDIGTKEFSVSYVDKNLAEIRNYCLKDAQTCAKLGNYLISKLKEFGIKTVSLYSAASLSYEYFSSRCSIVTIKRLWDYYRDVVRYAIEAYKGGKFECTARGFFREAWQYDIVSAYPFEIQNLLNITCVRVVDSKDYIPEADYAFLRVRICNENPAVYIPCAVKNSSGVDIYPVGKFYTTITKQEYDYLKELNIDVKILSGFWLIAAIKTYPYRAIIKKLFAIKALYKGKDAFLYEVSKKMMNSFYGKTLQMIPEIILDTDNVDRKGVPTGAEKTIYRAGRAFNPIYGAIITANTRIKITRIQNILKNRCLAVHTDSALTLEKLPPAMVSGEIGGFELQTSGVGVLVACGQYQIVSGGKDKPKSAYKGFKPFADEDWLSMLEKHGKKKSFEQDVLHVEGWFEAVSKGHYDRINVFQREKKIIDLNADTKRIWTEETNAKKLLSGIEQSFPQTVIDHRKPDSWL